MADAVPSRSFVPADVDPGDFAQLAPWFEQLLARPIGSAAELTRWLADTSELYCVVDERANRLYIDKSCHTDDPAIEKAFLHFLDEVDPKVKQAFFKLQQKYLASPWRKRLRGPRYHVLDQRWQADVDLFRPENVPLDTQVAKLVSEYDKIFGAMIVDFRGRQYTQQQLAKLVEEPDADTRREAWMAGTDRRVRDREAIDGLFEQMLSSREQMAHNAGLPDYRAYVWKSYKRFDYTPEDCLRFDETIARICVPLVQRLDEQRKHDLALESLRPWDLDVDRLHRPPLRPFAENEIPQFVTKVEEIFRRLSPPLADNLDSLRRHNNLDLDSRKGKQPGGYQCSLEESREPFIFMNAAGTQRDVETLLHEGGHAFNYRLSCHEPLVFLRQPPMEFAEVASMSMELLGAAHFNVFYNDADAGLARRGLLEGIIRFLPWMATIDSFQHWIYTHPGHSREQRTAEWMRLHRSYFPSTDWTGLDAARESLWQAKLHLFHCPFYYIEYGIAQLGALQLWAQSLQDPRKAIANYKAGLKLGGTRSLPDLFKATGIRFDVSEQMLGPLMETIAEEMAKLPR